MELHRVSLRFKFMIVRLVTEGDALLPQLYQSLAVDLDAVGSGGRGVVPENIAHVVQQARGRQQAIGRRHFLLPFHAVKEVPGVFVAVLLRHGKPVLCGLSFGMPSPMRYSFPNRYCA